MRDTRFSEPGLNDTGVVDCAQREDRRFPCTHIHEQPAELQFVAVPVVVRGAEEILQAPLVSAQVFEWESEAALALMRRVVHHGQQWISLGILPGEGNE